MVLSAVGSGVLLGMIIFFLFNHQTIRNGEPAGEPAAEADSGGIIIETDTEPAAEEPAEDFSDYYGTYVVKNGQSLIVAAGEEKDQTDTPRQIGAKSLLYIDEVRRGQDGEGLVGYGAYFGLQLRVPLDKLEKISENDYAIYVGDSCVISESWSQVTLNQEPRQDSETIAVSLYQGEALQVMDVRNGYMKTRTPEGVYGWVDGNYVTKLMVDIPYRMVCDESSGQAVIPFYLEIPGSADVVLGEADGSIGDGSVVWFENFSDGWGQAILEGTEVWMNMVNAVPVSQTEPRNIVDYQIYETEPEGRTDFYVDGRSVGPEEYIIPQAQYRYLEESDLSALTLKGISYAKNELYAKYGRQFESQELTEYMATKSWYVPRYEPRTYDSYIEGLMNEYERKNVELLYNREAALGMYSYDKS